MVYHETCSRKNQPKLDQFMIFQIEAANYPINLVCEREEAQLHRTVINSKLQCDINMKINENELI